MTTIAEVRDNLADICSTLTGWYGTTYVGDQINPGAIVVSRPAFDPRMVFSQVKAEHDFRLVAYAARGGSQASEAALDALCELSGDGSLIAAVQLSTNWTVTVDYAEVVLCGEVALTMFGADAAEYLACPFDVKVVF